MSASAWWGIPRLLFRSHASRKVIVLAAGYLCCVVAIFMDAHPRQPAPVPAEAPEEELECIRGLGFAGDTLIVATCRAPAKPDEIVKVRLWDAGSGQTRTVLTGHAGGVGCVAFTLDGRLVATEGYDLHIKLWEVATGQELPVLWRQLRDISPLAFDSAGGLAWVEDGLVHHWDAATAAVWVDSRVRVGRDIGGMAFSPDGQLLATTGFPLRDFETCLWELPAGALRAPLRPGSTSVERLCFAPSGRVLATGEDSGSVKLWDTATGLGIMELAGLSRPTCALAFSADGRSVAAGDVGGTVKIWDAATGCERESFATKSPRKEKQRDE
jgi:WD40 repeat protein